MVIFFLKKKLSIWKIRTIFLLRVEWQERVSIRNAQAYVQLFFISLEKSNSFTPNKRYGILKIMFFWFAHLNVQFVLNSMQ